MKNYYQILGVKPTASAMDIEEAFQRITHRQQPALNWAERIFDEMIQQVKEAYSVLSQEEKRNEYNHTYFNFFFKPEQDPEVCVAEPTPTVNSSKSKVRNIWLKIAGIFLLLFTFLGVNALRSSSVKTGDNTTKAEVAVAASKSQSILGKAPEQSKFIAVEQEINHKQNALLAEKPLQVSSVEEILVKHNVEQSDNRAGKLNEQIAARAPLATTIEWNEKQLLEIVENIKAAKQRSGSRAASVRLHQAANSNVSNAFTLAKFLQKEKFTIAGRLTTTTQAIGVNINCAPDCITIIVGKI